MKKILSLILCAALCFTLCFALTACGDKDGEEEAKKLVVATSPDFPPFENLENGKVVGIEVELLQLICDELGYEMVIEQIAFDSVVPGIAEGKYDCGMSGISVTPDRELEVLFTDPYCLAAQVIVVKTDSPITKKADLAGKKVSVQTGTTADAGCTDEGLDVQAFAANADAKAALTTGKVDAWVVDNLTAMQMVEEGDGLVILDEKMTEEPYAFAFAFGSEDLVAEIDKILSELIADGTVEAIFAEYGETYFKP